jgi:hypothetical protein
MHVPDKPFSIFRQDAVVVTRTTTQPGLFGDEPNQTVEVTRCKGDLQAGPKTRRRLQNLGFEAEARLFLDGPDFDAVQLGDEVQASGSKFVVEEKSDIDSSLMLKSR